MQCKDVHFSKPKQRKLAEQIRSDQQRFHIIISHHMISPNSHENQHTHTHTHTTLSLKYLPIHATTLSSFPTFSNHLTSTEIMSTFNNNNDAGDHHLPPGFRFHPTDEELISFYLIKKVLDSSFSCRAITEVDLNKSEPWELPEKAKMGEKEWYFFSLRDRKYPTGLRTNRATEAGYWKATGKDREIYSSKNSSLVGMKKTLVFYRGRAPKGEKSNWVMHEYRLEGKFSYHFLSRSSKDEWVISRVFQKTGGGGGASSSGGAKKSTRHCATVGSLISDVSSSSTTTALPPLLDSSPYAAAAPRSITTTHDGRRENQHLHVPCFSTAAMPPQLHQFEYGESMPVTAAAAAGAGGSYDGMTGFPSLRPLQDNLQFPLFFSGLGPTSSSSISVSSSDHHHSQDLMSSGGSMMMGGQWPLMENPKVERGRVHVGATELDCMWSY